MLGFSRRVPFPWTCLQYCNKWLLHNVFPCSNERPHQELLKPCLMLLLTRHSRCRWRRQWLSQSVRVINLCAHRLLDLLPQPEIYTQEQNKEILLLQAILSETACCNDTTCRSKVIQVTPQEQPPKINSQNVAPEARRHCTHSLDERCGATRGEGQATALWVPTALQRQKAPRNHID